MENVKDISLVLFILIVLVQGALLRGARQRLADLQKQYSQLITENAQLKLGGRRVHQDESGIYKWS